MWKSSTKNICYQIVNYILQPSLTLVKGIYFLSINAFIVMHQRTKSPMASGHTSSSSGIHITLLTLTLIHLSYFRGMQLICLPISVVCSFIIPNKELQICLETFMMATKLAKGINIALAPAVFAYIYVGLDLMV